jgi:hypothetical protein
MIPKMEFMHNIALHEYIARLIKRSSELNILTSCCYTLVAWRTVLRYLMIKSDCPIVPFSQLSILYLVILHQGQDIQVYPSQMLSEKEFQ